MSNFISRFTALLSSATGSTDIDAAALEALLLESPGLINHIDADGNSALHLAANARNLRCAELLLANGALVDIADPDGHTASFYAALNDDCAMLELLERNGADLGRTASFGGSLLHYAAMYSGGTAIRWLAARGLDVNGRSINEETPLQWAMYRRNLRAIDVLVELGAGLRGVSDIWGNTVLTAAILAGSLECTAALLDRGADINERSPELGRTPLHAAVGPANHRISPDIVGVLLDRGAAPDSALDDGTTALAWACTGEDPRIVKLLLDRGAKADDRHTLHPALRSGNDEIIDMILTAAGKEAHVDDAGKTALHLASEKGKASVVKELLLRGFKVDVRDASGMTPLHYAAAGGFPEIAAILLDSGASIDAADAQGVTALAYAEKHGNPAVASILSGRGAKAPAKKESAIPPFTAPGSLKRGEAVVRYLGHSGWAVETEANILIFDYWNAGSGNNPDASIANGRLVAGELAGRTVTIFASMVFPDHFDPGIFTLAGEGTQIAYVYGFDPNRKDNPYQGPAYVDIGLGKTARIGDIEVTTLTSTAGGAGFLVVADGLTIFHAGDHTNRRADLSGPFKAEIDLLARRKSGIDIAFLPVGGPVMAAEPIVSIGSDYAIKALNPAMVFPMHEGSREHKYSGFAAAMQPRHPGVIFSAARNRGDYFRYNRS